MHLMFSSMYDISEILIRLHSFRRVEMPDNVTLYSSCADIACRSQQNNGSYDQGDERRDVGDISSLEGLSLDNGELPQPNLDPRVTVIGTNVCQEDTTPELGRRRVTWGNARSRKARSDSSLESLQNGEWVSMLDSDASEEEPLVDGRSTARANWKFSKGASA